MNNVPTNDSQSSHSIEEDLFHEHQQNIRASARSLKANEPNLDEVLFYITFFRVI